MARPGPRSSKLQNKSDSHTVWAVKTVSFLILCLCVGGALGVTQSLVAEAARLSAAASEAKSPSVSASSDERSRVARKAVKGW